MTARARLKRRPREINGRPRRSISSSSSYRRRRRRRRGRGRRACTSRRTQSACERPVSLLGVRSLLPSCGTCRTRARPVRRRHWGERSKRTDVLTDCGSRYAAVPRDVIVVLTRTGGRRRDAHRRTASVAAAGRTGVDASWDGLVPLLGVWTADV